MSSFWGIEVRSYNYIFVGKYFLWFHFKVVYPSSDRSEGAEKDFL